MYNNNINRGYRNYNSFLSTEKGGIQSFHKLTSDFPDLVTERKPVTERNPETKTEIEKPQEMNFTEAIQKEKKIEDILPSLKPGHVSYTLVDRKLVVAYGPTIVEKKSTDTLNDRMHHAIHTMIRNWDTFIESCGEEEYARLYKMPMYYDDDSEEDILEEEYYEEDDYDDGYE
jgi:hypothetical protein